MHVHPRASKAKSCCGHSWLCCLGHNPNQSQSRWQGKVTGQQHCSSYLFLRSGTLNPGSKLSSPLRMQNATLKINLKKKKKGNSERRKGWKYLSSSNTDKKQTLAAAMQCLVYASVGCSSCSDQKHNKLSVPLNPAGSDSWWPRWQSPLPAFEWERWIVETATLEHIQDCFYKSKTVFTSSSF